MMADDVPPSALGTKEYWDSQYERELQNFKEFGDTGEVWFGYQIQSRLANWLDHSPAVTCQSRILDIGCGNGSLLIELADRGYTELYGIDYSLAGVELSKQLAQKEGADSVNIFLADILNEDTIKELIGSVDVCIDKGMFDAISLAPDNVQFKKETYKKSVLSLLKDEGLFVIVSCNWTGNELKEMFEKSFVAIDTIPAPSFQFGGSAGQTTSNIVFLKSLK